jgi:hypothetical protein
VARFWSKWHQPADGHTASDEADLTGAARAEEIERRNRYWFEHYEDFRCDVVVRHDHAGPHIGVIDQLGDGLGVFGSFPTRSMGPVDRGEFAIAGTIVTVLGARRTWRWDLKSTFVGVTPDLCEFRRANDLVVFLQGPVMAPICGSAWSNRVPGWDWQRLRRGPA